MEVILLYKECLLSPWEVEFKQVQLKPSRKIEELKITPDPEEEVVGVSEAVKQRFIKFMREQGKHCPAFVTEVDKKLYPLYTEIVKVEMYFTKIYNRLVGNYYRSLEALLHDIDLISINAQLFNDSSSVIVKQALCICEYLNLVLRRVYQEPDTLNAPDKREAEKLLRQIVGFGMTDKNYNFEKIIADCAVSHSTKSPDKLHDHDRFIGHDAGSSSNPYTNRLRKTEPQYHRTETTKLMSDDEDFLGIKGKAGRKASESQRTKRLRLGTESDEEEFADKPMKDHSLSRAERLRLRHKENPMPPVTNGGMRLRHRR